MGIKRTLAEAFLSLCKIFVRRKRAELAPSIFVLRNNDLGDVLVITGLFRALREVFPHSKITVGVGDWANELLQENPNISQVVSCNAPWHNKFTGKHNLFKAARYIFTSQEAKDLRAAQYDIGIDVLGSAYGSLLLMRMGVPVRLGRVGYAGGQSGATSVIPSSMDESVSVNALRFAQLLAGRAVEGRPQIFLTDAELARSRERWASIDEDASHLRIALCPGAGLPHKRWPVERFSELVSALGSEWCGFVLGDLKEIALGTKTIEDGKNWQNLCGKTSLRESAAIVSQCDVVVCNSSFVMHLAAALSKTCIVILNRTFDAHGHRVLWETPGIHFQCYPGQGEDHVGIGVVLDALDNLVRLRSQGRD